MSLYNILREYSLQKSIDKNIPAYCIFNNSVIKELCSLSPQNMDELLTIKGIGRHKANEYGYDILNICNGVEPSDIVIFNKDKDKKKKNKFYAVVIGHTPGIYTTWEECVNQTSGFVGNLFKSFPAAFLTFSSSFLLIK